MRHGGKILIDQFKYQKCSHVFCVPGQGLISALDGLYENAKLHTVSCRHESSAVLMAQVHGQITHRPGVCLVSGLQGAHSAAIGIHSANHNSTPLVLIVGLPKKSALAGNIHQNTDLMSLFQSQAKYVGIIEDTQDIAEYVGQAFHISMSGRPGPVVLGIPEDVFANRVTAEDTKYITPAFAAPSSKDISDLKNLLERSNRPLFLIGRASWSEKTSEYLVAFCKQFHIPVITAFQCHDYIDNHQNIYAGHIGQYTHPVVEKHISQADLLISVGGAVNNIRSQHKISHTSYTDKQIVNISSDALELAQFNQANLSIVSHSENFTHMLGTIKTLKGARFKAWCDEIRKGYESTLKPHDTAGDVKLEYIVRVLNEALPDNAIVVQSSGISSDWLDRYYQYKAFGTQVADISNSLGYGLPAAISAKLLHQDRVVVALVGDGCFLSSSQEIATAMHFGLRVIIIVVNNHMFGRARLHQEQAYPGRVLGTSLTNPNFVKLVESYGAQGEIIEHRKMFRAALKNAMKCQTLSLIDLKIDENAISPHQTLDDVRSNNKG